MGRGVNIDPNFVAQQQQLAQMQALKQAKSASAVSGKKVLWIVMPVFIIAIAVILLFSGVFEKPYTVRYHGEIYKITDNIEYEIATYLNEVTKGEISDSSAATIKGMYKIIGEMESLGDSGEAISRMLTRARVHGHGFDEAMMAKLHRMLDLVDAAYQAMMANLKASLSGPLTDISNASDAERVINEYRNTLREEHIANLEKAKYNYPAGVFYMDIISELERIGDFIINISQALVRDESK